MTDNDTDQKCDHRQLFAIVQVNIAVPVEHNSAMLVSKAKEDVTCMIDEAFDVCSHMPASYYNVGDTIPIRERASIDINPFDYKE